MSDIWRHVSEAIYEGAEYAILTMRNSDPYFAKCESEIERAFYATFVLMCRVAEIPLGHAFSETETRSIVLIPQVVVAQYRVDFVLGRANWPLSRCIAIECDGFDFHDRTKEQAARDKSRDRALQLGVAKVLRFTGSEIFRNPGLCGGEALQVLMSMSEGK